MSEEAESSLGFGLAPTVRTLRLEGPGIRGSGNSTAVATILSNTFAGLAAGLAGTMLADGFPLALDLEGRF
jgi:hypothetical protein